MLENIKSLIALKSVDKYINDSNYELALETLNRLVKEEFKPSETFLKRGRLCHKLLMLDSAYSDFTYVITHCVNKDEAYYERMMLNYEMGHYVEAINDSEKVLELYPENFEIKRIKFLSLLFSFGIDKSKVYILSLFNNNKYRTIQFLFNETAKSIAEDDLSKGLKLLDVIDSIDNDNPIMLLKRANIYGLGGDSVKEQELMKRIDTVFPKYFISHFRFTDMYEERDLLEVCFLLELKIFDSQNLFAYPMSILEGYKNQMEGHIIDSKECFERAIQIKPEKPEAYVLLAETLQLMSNYDNPDYKIAAEENYKIAMEIYEREKIPYKAENMRRQIKHLNSSLGFK